MLIFWYVQAYESQQAELLLRQSYSISMNTKILTFAESCDHFIAIILRAINFWFCHISIDSKSCQRFAIKIHWNFRSRTHRPYCSDFENYFLSLNGFQAKKIPIVGQFCYLSKSYWNVDHIFFLRPRQCRIYKVLIVNMTR